MLALGSFSDTSFDTFLRNMLTGLQNLKSSGATQLIVDVVCIYVAYAGFLNSYVSLIDQ